jgi:hypothetical protein
LKQLKQLKWLKSLVVHFGLLPSPQYRCHAAIMAARLLKSASGARTFEAWSAALRASAWSINWLGYCLW